MSNYSVQRDCLSYSIIAFILNHLSEWVQFSAWVFIVFHACTDDELSSEWLQYPNVSAYYIPYICLWWTI